MPARAGEELPEAAFWIKFASGAVLEEGSVCLASTASINTSSTDLVREVEALGRSLSLVRERIGEIIFGQREVVEQALALTNADKVEAAYRRGDLFQKREKLMADWAEYCGRDGSSGKVMGLGQAVAA